MGQDFLFPQTGQCRLSRTPLTRRADQAAPERQPQRGGIAHGRWFRRPEAARFLRCVDAAGMQPRSAPRD